MGINFENRRRFADTVAVASIKAFAMVTIIILVIILGYIFSKGLISNKLYESPVVPGHSSDNQPFSVLVNTATGFDTMQYQVLQKLYDGRTFSLRKLTGVDHDVELYVETGLEDSVIKYLEIDETSFKRSTPIIGSREEILRAMVASPGAIGLVHGSSTFTIPSNRIDMILLEDMVLAVHPSVTRLVGNIKLSKIDVDVVNGLLHGAFTSWTELNGQHLPVRVVGSLKELLVTEGSVALLPYWMVQHNEIDILHITARKQSQNFTFRYIFQKPVEMGKYGGISTIIGNTLLMVIVTLLIATPLGVGAAVFMVEYKANTRVMAIIRTGVDLLAGVPSIIFGLFGLLVFVQLAGWSFSLISGSMTVVIMILPTIIRTSEEALRTVSSGLREASVALGATKWETIWRVMLPAASPGIVAGVILAIGRAVGETAALIYTIGSGTALATGPFESARVLAMHIFLTITEGQSIDKAFASAMVLFVLVLIINVVARLTVRRFFRHGAT